jgi:hypothetical protein
VRWHCVEGGGGGGGGGGQFLVNFFLKINKIN